MNPAPILGIVVPCYNEESVLAETARHLVGLLLHLNDQGKVGASSTILFVDDGSQDRTWEVIFSLAQQHPCIGGLKLSRNMGHQNALLCGLLNAPGDALISLDADLQDDVTAIECMIDEYLAGADIALGVRSTRRQDRFFKRWTAEFYYKLLSSMGIQVVFNHADFRLMSRRAINALAEYREVHLYLRGLVPLLGFRTAVVPFDRAERFAGESKYPLGKMLSLAWQGIISFTAIPLRLITGMGVLVALASAILGGWALSIRLFTDAALPGWASTVVPMYFLGGVQLLAIGVMGEYLAKVYEQTKHRPRFHLEASCGAMSHAAEQSMYNSTRHSPT